MAKKPKRRPTKNIISPTAKKRAEKSWLSKAISSAKKNKKK